MGGEGIAGKLGDRSGGIKERLTIGAKSGAVIAVISSAEDGAEIGLGAKMGSAMCLVSEVGMGSGSESASELEDEKGTERAGRMG